MGGQSARSVSGREGALSVEVAVLISVSNDVASSKARGEEQQKGCSYEQQMACSYLAMMTSSMEVEKEHSISMAQAKTPTPPVSLAQSLSEEP